MKALKTLIICLIASFSVFSQENEIKLAVQTTHGFYTGFIDDGAWFHTSKIDIGLDFQRESNDFYLYLSYDYNINNGYKGHFLGASFESHFLNNKKRIRPYFGFSVSSEIATNYHLGFLIDSSFQTNPNQSRMGVYSGKEVSYYINSSGFYYSTPLHATLSIGGDLRIVKGLRLNISFGYSVRLMKYKYIKKWYDNEDYLGKLSQIPVETVLFSYYGGEIGLSYSFSIKKREKRQEE